MTNKEKAQMIQDVIVLRWSSIFVTFTEGDIISKYIPGKGRVRC